MLSKRGRSHGLSSGVKVAIVAAVILIAAGAYFSYGKKHAANESNKEAEAGAVDLGIVPSGLNQGDSVDNVGDVEKVIAKWVEANPKAIINAVVNMQNKMAQDQMKEAQKNIGAKKAELFESKSDGQHAPEGYNVTIVEFFDYNCGYCKRAQTTVDQLVKEDSKVRVIYKEFPILSQSSRDLSTVAVAVNAVSASSYKKFHDALMKSNSKTKADAVKVAKSVGVDSAKLESYLKSNAKEIEKVIQDNLALGSAIGVNGTPGFVIGEELIPGAVDIASLKQKIAAVRSAGGVAAEAAPAAAEVVAPAKEEAVAEEEKSEVKKESSKEAKKDAKSKKEAKAKK